MTEKKVKYFYGTGRRKTAIARVRIIPTAKDYFVNNQANYFDETVFAPFNALGQKNNFGFSVLVSGGGKSSQLKAIQLGIARALVQSNPDFRLPLKKSGFLRRDPREVERKKPGLKKARRAPQWSKR